MRRAKVNEPQHIIISHVYSSDNKGDAALTSVLIEDLRQKFPDAAVTLLKLEAVKAPGQFEGIPEAPSFMCYALNRYQHPLLKLNYVLYMMVITVAWAVWRRTTGKRGYLPAHLRTVASLYGRADLIVAVGGGYIRSRSGIRNRLNIPLLLHPLIFGWLLGKPTVLYPQSVGPFQNRLEEALVAFVLRRMTLIMLREDTSVALLARLGVTQKVVRAVDSGFLLRTTSRLDIRKRYHVPPRQLVVGVTVRAWLRGEAQDAYERAVAGALDNIVARFGAHIIFIPQVTAAKGDDDRITSRRVFGYMTHQAAATVVEDEPDHHQIKAMYDGLDALLGTRFHSVIFSLTSYVPVLAIEYEHKTSGIMRDLGLGQWVIKIEDVTVPALTTALHRLLRRRNQYKADIHERLPAYLRQARQTIELLEASVYERPQTP